MSAYNSPYSSPFGSRQSSPRNRMAKGDKSWIDVQRNTFTNWANVVLRKSLESIDDLQVDLSDGLMLKCMYEVLADKDFGRFKTAKMRISKVENLSRVLKKFSDDGLRLVNIGAEDICDGNLKIILGLLWSLITKYQIMAMREQVAQALASATATGGPKAARGGGESPTSPKKILLQWVNAQLADYPTEVKNFRNSWKDGRALCDLVDSFAPNELLPAHDRPEGSLSRIEKAMSIAEKRLGVPRVLDREHLLSGADDLSTMTYISYFQKAELLPEKPPTPKPELELESPEKKVKHVEEGNKTNLWKNGAHTETIVDNGKNEKDDGAFSNGAKRSSGVLDAKDRRQNEDDSSFAGKSATVAATKTPAAVKKRAAKKGKQKVSVLPCSNCKRVLPDRNFKVCQKKKGDVRQCERCVRREPVFTEPRK